MTRIWSRYPTIAILSLACATGCGGDSTTSDPQHDASPGTQHSLTIQIAPLGSGTVAPSGGTFAHGARVSVTANPNSGWQFDHWGGDLDSEDNPAEIVMSQDRLVVAIFVKQENPSTKHTLTIQVAPAGSGTVNPAGGSFEHGSRVSLTANPNSGWQFDYWGGDLSGEDNPAEIVMSQDRLVVANFVKGAPAFLGENNYGLLDAGDGIGNDEDPNSLLRRRVTASLSVSSDKFQIGDAWLGRLADVTGHAYVTIPIKNISSQGYCLVRMRDVRYRDSSGDVVANVDSRFVFGSVGIANGQQTQTCLAPGEWGFLLDIKLAADTSVNDPYWAFDSVRFALEYLDQPVTNPLAQVFPRSGQHLGESLVITVQNRGTVPAFVARDNMMHMYLLFDDDDCPLVWGFLDDDIIPTSGTIDVGLSGSVSDDSFYFDGLAVTVFASLDFIDVSSSKRSFEPDASPPTPCLRSRPECDQEILERMNERWQ
ncbi:MAG: hypothetical protein V2A73_02165 [Pseudomonadota bacterium]